jgi:hypothetical protein
VPFQLFDKIFDIPDPPEVLADQGPVLFEKLHPAFFPAGVFAAQADDVSDFFQGKAVVFELDNPGQVDQILIRIVALAAAGSGLGF